MISWLTYLISILIFSCLFFFLGKEEGYHHGKTVGFQEGYSQSTLDRINSYKLERKRDG